MIKIRFSNLKAGIALSCVGAIGSSASGQIVVQAVPQIVVQAVPQSVPANVNVLPPKPMPSPRGTQHLGNGPIDMNNLPADVLNCDVCRQRLGLPPLPKSPALSGNTNLSNSKVANPAGHSPVQAVVPTQPKSALAKPPQPDTPPVPMLGSPGLISSATASQMKELGIVVDEFKPPLPAEDAIQLGDIPPEARQQFIKSLELPSGAQIMSAEVKGKQRDVSKAEPTTTSSNEETSVAELISQANAESIKPAPSTDSNASLPNEKTAKATQPAEEAANDFAKKQAELERSFAEKMAAWAAERETLAKERSKLKQQLEQMQSEWLKRMAQADAANREALTMLEKRTAEMNEMQVQLKELKEALVKAQSGSKE